MTVVNTSLALGVATARPSARRPLSVR